MYLSAIQIYFEFRFIFHQLGLIKNILQDRAIIDILYRIIIIFRIRITIVIIIIDIIDINILINMDNIDINNNLIYRK